MIVLNEVNIQNFTVFEDMSVELSQGINIFIGENGSGKTHLMKFVYVLDNMLQKYLPFLSNRKVNNEHSSVIYKNVFGVCVDRLYADNKKEIKINIRADDGWLQFNTLPHIDFYGGIADDGKGEDEFSPIIFIPAKDMLTHSSDLPPIVRQRNVPSFDDTLMQIVDMALMKENRKTPELAKDIVPMLEEHIGGKITVENNDFYVEKFDGKKVKFSVEAEGIKKIGLLWRLLMNESITKDTILFWDEPEANINPKLIPVVVEILLALSRQGVQIFTATHDYLFAKYVEVRRKKDDKVMFHSLYKTDNGVKCESNVNYRDLENNAINETFDELMDEVIYYNVGD